MTGAELSSDITSRQQSQGGSLYVTARAHCRGSFVSSDAAQALASLRDKNTGFDYREDELLRVLFKDDGS